MFIVRAILVLHLCSLPFGANNAVAAEISTIPEVKELGIGTDTIEFIKKLKINDKVEFQNELWIVISIENIPETNNEPPTLKVTLKSEKENRFTKDFLILEWKQTPFSKGITSIAVEKINKLHEPRWKKIVLGALAIGGGVYLATTFASAYLNQVYEKASPWLDSLRAQFQSTLDTFKGYQSK